MRPLTPGETWILLGGIFMGAIIASVVGIFLAALIQNVIEKYREEHRGKRD
jgi:hypothetical protein